MPAYLYEFEIEITCVLQSELGLGGRVSLVVLAQQQAKEENMVEGPDGQMMSKKAYKKLMKKIEKEKKKAESEWLGSYGLFSSKKSAG